MWDSASPSSPLLPGELERACFGFAHNLSAMLASRWSPGAAMKSGMVVRNHVATWAASSRHARGRVPAPTYCTLFTTSTSSSPSLASMFEYRHFLRRRGRRRRQLQQHQQLQHHTCCRSTRRGGGSASSADNNNKKQSHNEASASKAPTTRKKSGVVKPPTPPSSSSSSSSTSNRSNTGKRRTASQHVVSTTVELPGDVGFDPLGLAKGGGARLIAFREAEVIHARWAMLGFVGVRAFGFTLHTSS